MISLPETINGVSFVSAYSVHTPADGALRFSNRPRHGLVLFLQGCCDYHYENATYTARPGSLLFLPRDVPYSIVPRGDSDCLCVNFFCDEMKDVPFFSIDFVNTSSVQSLFEKTITTWKRHESGHVCKCLSYLYAVLAEIQRYLDENKEGLPYYHRLKKAYKHIHKHYNDPDLRIGFLAEECHMSERYFRHSFQETFGVSPHKYITNLRMACAVELLSSQMISVSEVALQCGYKDICYFSRVFKQYYGKAPLYYARSWKLE